MDYGIALRRQNNAGSSPAEETKIGYNKIMKFTPTKFEIDALREYITEHDLTNSSGMQIFMLDPEPGPMLYNIIVFGAARELGLNILEVAADIQSKAYYAKLDALPPYQTSGSFEWVEGDKPESECEPGFNDNRCHDCHCGECS